jgi:hypothetical protein
VFGVLCLVLRFRDWSCDAGVYSCLDLMFQGLLTCHLMLSGARSMLLELLNDRLLFSVWGCETVLYCDLDNL